MTDSVHPIQYNLIICRYNEIGLKSRKVRSRMEQRLVKHIKKICKREKLPIISAKREWGRFIFEFTVENMPRALTIFRYIIGLHSFSPAIRIDHSYESLTANVREFGMNYIQTGDSFVIRARRVKSYPKTSLEIEREMGEVVLDLAAELHRDIHVKMKNPNKTIYIEVREAAAFLFSTIIYTIWGGNPIEVDKPVIALWRGHFADPTASQLMLRRGSIVFPVVFIDEKDCIFNSTKSKTEVLEEIRLIAKYLPEPVTTLQLNVEPFVQYLDTIASPSIKKVMQAYSTMYLLDNLGKEVNFYRELKFNKQELWIKGILSSFNLKDHLYCILGQNLILPHFMPITGLVPSMIQSIHKRLTMTSTQIHNDEFTVADIVLDGQQGADSESFSPFSDRELNLSEILSIITENMTPELKTLLDSIIDNRQKVVIHASIYDF